MAKVSKIKNPTLQHKLKKIEAKIYISKKTSIYLKICQTCKKI